MSVTLSRLIHVANNIATVSPTIRLGGLTSWGASMLTGKGWSLVKDWAISLKPGGGAPHWIVWSRVRHGQLMQQSWAGVPLFSHFCSSTWWCQALLLLELWLQQCHLKLPRLGGTCPTGVTGWGGCISIWLGNSWVRATSFFWSVSCGVGGMSGSPAGKQLALLKQQPGCPAPQLVDWSASLVRS